MNETTYFCNKNNVLKQEKEYGDIYRIFKPERFFFLLSAEKYQKDIISERVWKLKSISNLILGCIQIFCEKFVHLVTLYVLKYGTAHTLQKSVEEKK